MRQFVNAILVLLLVAGCGSPFTHEQLGTAGVDASSDSTAAQSSSDSICAPSKVARAVDISIPENSSGRIQLAAANTLDLGKHADVPYKLLVTSPLEIYTRKFEPLLIDGFPDDIPLAYKGYCFELGSYSGELNFTFSWVENTPALGNLYIAAADFTRDAWTWFYSENNTQLALPSREPYINEDGELFLLVMVLNEAAELGWIRVGGNAPPFTDIRLEGLSTPHGPIMIDSYWGCFDADGTLANLAYDLDNDGIYETTSGSSCYLPASFHTTGTHEIGIQAIDDEGLSSTGQQSISVSDWQVEEIATGYCPYSQLDGQECLQVLYTDPDKHKYYATYAADDWQHEQLPGSLDDKYARCLAVDSNNTPYTAFSGDGIIFYTKSSDAWVEACPSLSAELPFYSTSFLEVDVDGLLHFCSGTELPPNLVFPQNLYTSELKYWYFDGTSWIERQNTVTQDHFFGFNLDADHNTPQYAAAMGNAPNSTPAYNVWNSITEGWEEQAISDSAVYYASYDIASSKNYVFDWSQLKLYVQNTEGWQAVDGPNINGGTVDGSFTTDSTGTIHAVIELENYDYYTKYSDTLYYCTYSNGEWHTQKLLESQISTFGNLELFVTSSGVVHIVYQSAIHGDLRSSTAYGGDLPETRIMHIWH